MKKNGIFGVFVIVSLFAVSSLIAQDSLNIRCIGRAIGGRGLSGEFVGTTMLLGTENALLALNVATPASLILVGQRFIDGGVSDIAVLGDIVALALRDRGVQLVYLSAGRHSFALSGAKLPSGTYLIKLATEDVSQAAKILLVR